MAFTILICSLLTSLSLGAPVLRPSFAFPDLKIPHTFSGRNTARTWARTSQGSKSPDCPLSHVSCSIRRITRRPLLFPNSQCCHSNNLPHGLPAMPCTWRRDSLSTFRICNLLNTVGGIWTPVVQQFRTGTLSTCNLTTSRTHRGACFDLLVPVGLSPLDDACDSSMSFTVVPDSRPSPDGTSG